MLYDILYLLGGLIAGLVAGFLIAKKFNLSEQSIHDIANNKSYSYLRQFYNNHM